MSGKDIDREFGPLFRTARTKAGLSQGVIAQAMTERGWSYYQNTVHRVEAGKQPVTIGEMHDLVAALTSLPVSWEGLEDRSWAQLRECTFLAEKVLASLAGESAAASEALTAMAAILSPGWDGTVEEAS